MSPDISTSSGKRSDAVRTSFGVCRPSHTVKRDAYAVGAGRAPRCSFGMPNSEGNRPTNTPRLHGARNPARLKPHRVNDLDYAPGGTRIPNLLIRSQMLYPIELRAHMVFFIVLHGRYKTRTCDLHDVNVAL